MNRVFRIAQIASSRKSVGLLPVSRTTIWRWVRNKKFPSPVRLSPGVTAWRSEDIEAWLNNSGDRAA